MIKALRNLILVVIVMLTACSGEEISMQSLLNDMLNREAITMYPDEIYALKQFSSYDRNSTGPEDDGWFANADYSRFIREDNSRDRREFVLFEDEGPGAIVRWWMTFAGEGSHEGILRVYIDNSDNPVIEDNVLKVISGQLLAGEPLSSSVSPKTDYYRRGHNLYLPLPYNKGCRITYECDAVKNENGRITPSIYYNINYREYSKRTRVESFSNEVLTENSDLIDRVNKRLTEQHSNISKPLQASGSIDPGDTLSINVSGSGIAIDQIMLQLYSGNLSQALRSTVVSISFDANTSVWVPAGDFFGTGFNLSESETWYSGVSLDGKMTSRWIMPFKKEASISIINFGHENIYCNLEASTKAYKWTSKSMYFSAVWHEYNKIQSAGAESVGGTGKHFDINYVDIEGKGIYIGDAVTIFNTADAWWGEGDEKIFVDNESFPSSIGTGTEDYYGYAWCRPEEFSHPFIAQPSGKGNFHPGMSINMRYRILDAIPFQEKISSNIELWHWAPAIMNYALTSYFYVLPGYSVNIKPNPEDVKIAVPKTRSDIIKPIVDNNGVLEGENLQIEKVEGLSPERQFIASWDWSGKGQLWILGGKPGSNLVASFISEEAGTFAIKGRFSKARDYGITDYYINDKKAIRVNAYTDGEEVIELALGNFNILKGRNTIRIEIVSSDPLAKPQYMAGLDMLKLNRVYEE